MPSALAVLRLITSSNSVGCSIGSTLRDDQIYRNPLQLSCQLWYTLNGIVAIAKNDDEIATLDKAKISKARTKSIHVRRQACGLLSSNPADTGGARGWLGMCGQGPDCRTPQTS